MSITLLFHQYRYFPYERQLAAREAVSVSRSSTVHENDNGICLSSADLHAARQLTYFSKINTSKGDIDTTQGLLESQNGASRRQATRYSVHGLHEYKGKFNPQIAKALLNLSGVGPEKRTLDPFCGSGTTLVEAMHLGAFAVGFDVNPLAIYISNAKTLALKTPCKVLWRAYEKICKRLSGKRKTFELVSAARNEYLGKWFDPDTLKKLDDIRAEIIRVAPEYSSVFLSILSNLLRTYSLQDPKDLRIRRRSSPLPETPLETAFMAATQQFLQQLNSTQQILGESLGAGVAIQQDVTCSSSSDTNFDIAVTSPPYAMALPYIDTQRLSIVWLELDRPDNLSRLESGLIGSREFRGSRVAAREILSNNAANLPEAELSFCQKASDALSSRDGFRRQAVPALLYRYFSQMKASFQSVHAKLRPGAPYHLVVGHNHTTLGGERLDIDTPSHLASIATSVGWVLEESMPLQTYHRWGYHAANAIAAETLLTLRKA